MSKKMTTRVDAWVQPTVSQNSFVTAAEPNPSQLILFSVTVVMQVCGKLASRLNSQDKENKECSFMES